DPLSELGRGASGRGFARIDEETQVRGGERVESAHRDPDAIAGRERSSSGFELSPQRVDPQVIRAEGHRGRDGADRFETRKTNPQALEASDRRAFLDRPDSETR